MQALGEERLFCALGENWYQASQTGTASVNGFTPQTVDNQKGSVYQYTNGNVTITLVAREVAVPNNS